MPTRLALKLVLALVILVVVVEGGFAIFNLKVQEQQLLQKMILGVDQLSGSIASATWHAMLEDNRGTAYEVMQTIAAKQGIDRIRIFNKEGRIMFSTGPEAGTMVDTNAEACFLCHAKEQPLVRVDVPSRARIFRGPEGARKLGMITPLYNEPACSAAPCHAHPEDRKVLGVLDVNLNLAQVDEELAQIEVRTAVFLAMQILLLGIFIILFTRRFVHTPIRKLIEGTKAVSAMDLDRPIVIDSSEELQALARAFNDMREQLKRALSKINEFTQSLETKVEERTEQLRLAQQKLVHSDRLASLGQLAASVAHEINNPLSGVLNLSMLMQRIVKDDGIPPGRVEEFRGYLSQVVRETTRLGRIVSDLLAFSRRTRPQRGAADLNDLVRNTVSLIAHKMELSNVQLELELEEELPALLCDGSQIQQAVMNLLLNAAEAIRGGGRVNVETRTSTDGDAVELVVTDTGSGIAPQHIPRIFDPFFTTKEEGKGVGLGLAVVYGIVESHGGSIEVASTVGKGTTFRVTLPLTPPEAAPAGDSVGSTKQKLA